MKVGTENMHLNILYFAPKESTVNYDFLSWNLVPQQDLFLLQYRVEKIALGLLADGRQSNSEADNFALWPRANLVISGPHLFIKMKGGGVADIPICSPRCTGIGVTCRIIACVSQFTHS